MPPNRLPIVDSDDGVWGDILRQYLMQEHVNDDTDNPLNGGHKTITIQPGTTAAGTAPLKFTSGTLLTTPEAGAIEFLSDTLYFTDSSGPTRRAIASYPVSGGAEGDIYYRNSSGAFTRLGVGSNGEVLTVTGGIPAWSSSGVASKLDSADFTTKVREGSNFVVNSDFEDTTVGRTNYGNPISPGYSTEQSRSGTNSWKWTTPTLGNTSGLQFDLSDNNISTNVTARVQSGDKFYISAWIYAHASNSHGAGGAIQLTARFSDSKGALSNSFQSETINLSSLSVSTWTKLHVSLDTPNGYDRLVVYVTANNAVPQNNIYYVDDLVWQPVSTYRQGGELEFFNTKDEETNYEKVRQYWNSDVFHISTDVSGTGTDRTIQISGGNSQIHLPSSSGILLRRNGTAVTSLVNITSNSLQSSSGIQSALTLTPTVNQSGTAGYSMLLVNPTESATGSGTKLLADFQVGSASVASISSIGAMTAMKAVLSPNSGHTGLVIDRASGQPSIQAGSSDGHLIMDSNGTTLRLNNYVSDNVSIAAGGGRVAIGTSAFTNNGKLEFTASTSSTEGIAFGGDTNLYRSASDTLRTDDTLIVGTPGTSAGSVATIDGSQVLTNKTISGSSNTLTNIASALTSANYDLLGSSNKAQLLSTASLGAGKPTTVISPIYNDIMYHIERGGTVTVTKNASPASSPTDYNYPAEAFNPHLSPMYLFPSSTSDVFVIEVDHSSYHNQIWGSTYGIEQRGAGSYMAQDITIEAWDTVAGSWVSIGSTTNDTSGSFASTINTGNARTKIRYTITNFASTTGARINSLYVVGSGSELLDNAYVSLAGGTLVSGHIQDTNDPTSDDDLARRGYVNSGTATLSNKTLSAPRVDTVYDTSGNQSIEIYAGTGASRWQFRNSATPTVYAVGSATDISMNIVPKGAGILQAGGIEVVTVSGTQTLTNKTVSGVINAAGATFSSSALTAGDREEVNFGATSLTPESQFIDTGAQGSSFAQVRYSDSGNAPYQIFAKSRGATIGARQIVTDGDGLGTIAFDADDGTNFLEAARIRASVDGTPDVDDMPGRLDFYTTSSGQSSSSLAMTIKSDKSIITQGNIELGHTSDTTISRASAGRIAVEGVNVVTESSTDTLTNKTISAGTLSGNTSLTGTIDYTPDSGTILSFDGKAAILRHGGGTSNSMSIGADDTLYLGAGESRAQMVANIASGPERVEIGAENGVNIHVADDNWSSGWSARSTTEFTSSGITWDGNTVWHAGNDGSGSGLDADTVDGVHGTDLMLEHVFEVKARGGSNLIISPDFEDTSIARTSYQGYDGYSTEQSHSDNYSLKWTHGNGSGGSGIYMDPSEAHNSFHVAGGDIFYYEAWVYPHASNTTNGSLTMFARAVDSTGVNSNTYPSFSVPMSSLTISQWNKVSGYIYVPETGYDILVPAVLSTNTTDGNIYYVDDVVFREVTEAHQAKLAVTEGNLVYGGDFQTDSDWENAWGSQTTDQAIITGGKSRELVSTNSGASSDYIAVSHDGTGNPVEFRVTNDRQYVWRVWLRKKSGNTGGGNIILQTFMREWDGSTSTIDSEISESELSNSDWTWFEYNHKLVNKQSIQFRVALDGSVPSGDTFYVAGLQITDITGGVSPYRVETLTKKTIDGANNTLLNIPWSESLLTSGITTLPRQTAANTAVTLGSGGMRFVMFTAPRDETMTNVTAHTGTTAAGATPTLCRFGLYEHDGVDTWDLVASTPNDTSLFASASTMYQKAFSSTYDVVAGRRYAIGILVVSAQTMPSIRGQNFDSDELDIDPKLSGYISGQSDIPGSVTDASMGNTSALHYFRID